MAAEFDTQKDMQAHEGTYSLFLKMMKRGTIAVAIITIFVMWLIT